MINSTERQTEYAEHDVYLVKSRYDETDREIRKTEPLKAGWPVEAESSVYVYMSVYLLQNYELSVSCIVNEVFHFAEELRPVKVSRFYRVDLSPEGKWRAVLDVY